MSYYERLKELREERNLSQEALAKILNTSQQYYGKYELGKRPLPIDHLKTLCLFYHVSADYILGIPKGLDWPRENNPD